MKLQFRVLKDLGGSLLVHIATLNPGDNVWKHSGVILLSTTDFIKLKTNDCTIEITSDISVNAEIQKPTEASV